MSSALSIKLRTGQIDLELRAAALTTFNRMVAQNFTTLVVTPMSFRLATSFVDQFDLCLRSVDALHLAIASEHSATICTLDKRLAAAAPKLGILTVTIPALP